MPGKGINGMEKSIKTPMLTKVQKGLNSNLIRLLKRGEMMRIVGVEQSLVSHGFASCSSKMTLFFVPV